ncbi:Homoisocitrate dehydrogenase [compost metagenome]
MILAAIQMLEYLGMQDKAERIREAVRATIESGDRVTRDLGGTASTSEFTQAIIDRL